MLSPNGRGRDAGKPGFALLLSQAGLDAAAQDRLQKIADAADALETARRKSESLKEEREAISTDQERIRENLKAAAGGSDLAKLMTRKLLAQETRMDTIDTEAKTAEAARDVAQGVMEDLAGKAGQTFRFSGANKF